MYWSFRDETAVMGGITMKGRSIIMCTSLQEVFGQLHIYHVGIMKMKLLACKSIYWTNTNTNIEDTI